MVAPQLTATPAPTGLPPASVTVAVNVTVSLPLATPAVLLGLSSMTCALDASAVKAMAAVLPGSLPRLLPCRTGAHLAVTVA
ncbi:hypothetical protein D3C72_2455520 [compost metagenome]